MISIFIDREPVYIHIVHSFILHFFIFIFLGLEREREEKSIERQNLEKLKSTGKYILSQYIVPGFSNDK